MLGLGAEGTNLEKKARPGEDDVRGGETTREGKTRDLLPVALDRRCKWTVAGIDRYVVEGEVMEEGGNRFVDVCCPSNALLYKTIHWDFSCSL